MAIDNTENICFNRECTNRAVKHNISDIKPANHNELDKSVVYAIKQLNVIKYYMLDYVEIIKGCVSENKDVQEYLSKLKDRNELIWLINSKFKNSKITLLIIF